LEVFRLGTAIAARHYSYDSDEPQGSSHARSLIDRLAVTGRNGSGKTTLLQALLGEMSLAAGSRYIGPGVRLGELEQRRAQFAGSKPLLETFCAPSGLADGDARTLLAKFVLGADEVSRAGDSLSPGERTRAAAPSSSSRTTDGCSSASSRRGTWRSRAAL
jgi:ATPase subunit of ABC transporter with duplicated ATPase domains